MNKDIQGVPEGHVVVTWDQDRTRILAVTRQDDDGRILSVIAEVPGTDVQSKGMLTDEQKGARWKELLPHSANYTSADWFEAGACFAESAYRAQSPAVGADDLVHIVGIRDGVETIIGTATIPPNMKARELVRQYFGPFDHAADGGETDAGMAYAICEELIDWMAKTPQVVNVTAQPPVQGTKE